MAVRRAGARARRVAARRSPTSRPRSSSSGRSMSCSRLVSRAPARGRSRGRRAPRRCAPTRRCASRPRLSRRTRSSTRPARARPAGTIATVDAGAHMLVAMPLWQVDEPGEALISSGLATMGFALPAAIAAALARPDRRVVCFVGDGGLGMTLAELETLARLELAVVVVVFNDSALSLIQHQAGGRGPRGRGGRALPRHRLRRDRAGRRHPGRAGSRTPRALGDALDAALRRARAVPDRRGRRSVRVPGRARRDAGRAMSVVRRIASGSPGSPTTTSRRDRRGREAAPARHARRRPRGARARRRDSRARDRGLGQRARRP